MKKYKLGLIGYPLTHSFSKKYFSEKFACDQLSFISYHNFPIENIHQFPQLLKNNPDLIGLNVTIPYKEKILAYTNRQSDDVKAIGAANTLVITDNGEVHAYNTDIYGFKESLKPYLRSYHNKALILGTGGAAKAVAYALKQLQIDYLMVSRTPKNDQEIGYEEINKDLMKSYLLVINTTPLGMMPQVDLSPSLPYDFITAQHLFYDLIYNPPLTNFLRQASNKGATVVNGLNMLHLQAEKSWQIWLKNSAIKFKKNC